MNPLVSLVLLVTGLRAGRSAAAAATGGADQPVPSLASGALAAGLVGVAAFVALLGVVIACCALGLAAVLFL
ncbi:MAG: hypothetical protein PGN11_13395 [Quadrisphaera sp.]